MIRRLIAAAVLACPAFAAQADNKLSNSYWEAAYLNSAVDFGGASDDEVEGFRGKVSLGLLPYLNFVGDYDQRRYASDRESFYSVGFGGHTLDPTWQVFGAVTYERYDFDDNLTSAGDFDDEGYGVQLGGRATLPYLEFNAAYKYFDFGNVDSTTTLKGSRYGVGMALDLTTWWSLVAEGNIRTHEFESNTGSADVEYGEWSVGFRRYFATQNDPQQRVAGLLSGLFAGE